VSAAAVIDLAGGRLGGAARFRAELLGYLARRPRKDIKVIGAERELTAAWLAAREVSAMPHGRRIALNNVGFIAPGGERWTLLRNALHFLSGPELAALPPALRVAVSRQAGIVHRAARRSDVLIAPCTAMAERISAALPCVADRVVVRMHPVTVTPAAAPPGGSLILCPVLFAPYKEMADRVSAWLDAVDRVDESVRLLVTASTAEVPASLAANPRLHLVGRLGVEQTRALWTRCRAVYFPTELESFGYPLAEARATGRPVIAMATAQNREIAGTALCGYDMGDRDSLRSATETALRLRVAPDPEPFDPDAYFGWMLGGLK